MKKKLLIDMDIVAFRAAASCERKVDEKKKGLTEPDPEYVALGRLNQIMEKIIKNCGSDDISPWFSGGENFRYSIFPEYKCSRKDKPKPTHYIACQEYSYMRWGAKVTNGIEADDQLVIEHVPGETIICSNDKDFRSNAAGHHYNFTLSDEKHLGVEYVDEGERKVLFMYQMLMGDKADDIIGPFGHGAHVAVQNFLQANKDLSRTEQVKLAYVDKWGAEEGPKWERLNYRLLRMLQSTKELDVIKEEKRRGLYPNFGQEETDIRPVRESKGKKPAETSQGQDTGEVSIKFGAR